MQSGVKINTFLTYLFLEFDTLADFARIAVDQEALGRVDPLKHGIFDHVEHDLIRYENALLHHLVQLVATSRT